MRETEMGGKEKNTRINSIMVNVKRTAVSACAMKAHRGIRCTVQFHSFLTSVNGLKKRNISFPYPILNPLV
jgi:hypothetical protein